MSDSEWKNVLPQLSYNVLRKSYTEPAFSSSLNFNKKSGYYACMGCKKPLYSSENKYDSGSGSNNLLFKYNIQAGDAGSSINYSATNSLTLPKGVSLTDAFGNDAVLTLPSPGSAASAGSSISIDEVRPTVTYQKAAVGGTQVVIGFSEAVLQGVKDAVDDGVPVFGGTAADNDVTNKWSLFSSKGGVSKKNGAVLVLGWSSVEVACCMASGFKPTERKGVATKVDGYWLKEIDDRPALAMYNEWTNSEGMVGLTTNSSGTTAIAGMSSWQPLGEPLDAETHFRVLHPMKADSAAGSLKLAGSVPPGTELTLLRGEADSLVANILETSERLAPKECLGAFMILCGGLVMAMEEEIEGVYEELANVVVRAEALGMCAFGEQGPNCNRESMHGNLMFGVLMFSNKPVRPSQVPTREPS